MQRHIAYRMKLNILANNLMFFAVNIDFDIGVIETDHVQSFFQLNRIQADHQGFFVTAINNRGNAAKK